MHSRSHIAPARVSSLVAFFVYAKTNPLALGIAFYTQQWLVQRQPHDNESKRGTRKPRLDIHMSFAFVRLCLHLAGDG